MNNQQSNEFTCSNCSQVKKTSELAKKVEVFEDEPIRTCRECYNFYHNPPMEKKQETHFFCSFCRSEVISVKYRKRVGVSEPNELGLKNGETYNFCSVCNKKVKEYNEAQDRDLEKNPYEPWE